MYVECEPSGEGLCIGRIGASAAMEQAENSNSASAKMIELHPSKEEQSEAMESLNCDAENEHQVGEGENQVAYFHQRLHEMIAGASWNFDSWSTLIEEVERICPDNLDIISLLYDSFLSRFPLCHWYWRKYADHIVRLSDAYAAIKVFERAVGSTTFSVGLWVDYCRFGMSFYVDPFDVRRLFKRALMFVKKDYFCHALWNEYIKFESTHQQWGFLANIYLQVLRFPTEYLHKYYENFKQFVSGMEEELRKHSNCRMEVEALHNGEVKWSECEISQVIKDLQNPINEALLVKAIHTYKSIGEEFYQKANELNGKIKSFETNIERRYFDTSHLDEEQLQNWHQYLDFIERQEDFDWALQVYERCLIPCAYYPEFWMRYVEFMESKGGREFANSALERATQVFLKDVPEIHLFNARFKEGIGDTIAAFAALVQCDMGSDSFSPRRIIELANMKRRLGKLEEATDTLDKAIDMAEKMQKLHNYSSLFIHSSRLKYLITGSADTARDILIDGIQRIPHCCELLEELIKFAMSHEGSKHVNLLDSIIASAISPSSDGSPCLALEDRQRISSLFLEFVDLCGTVHDMRKVWIRHVQLFPQLLRNNVVDKQLDSGKCLSSENLERESVFCALRDLQSEGQNSYQPVQEHISVVPVSQTSKAEVVCADQSPHKCCENIEYEREQQISKNEITFAASEVNEPTHDQVLQPVDDTAGEVESTDSPPQQPKGNATGPMETTPALVHVSNENMSGPEDFTGNFDYHSTKIAVLGSPQKHSSSIDNQDQELEQLPIPVSFDNLSLHSEELASRNLVTGASNQLETTLDVSKSNTNRPQDCLNSSNLPPATSPYSISAADSVQVQECLTGPKSASFLSSASQQKRTAPNTHPTSVVTLSSSGENHQMTSGTIPEISGMHLPSKLQHQDQHPSTLQHNPIGMGSHQPLTQAYSLHPSVQEQIGHSQVQNSGVAQENVATNHSWPVKNVQDVSSLSTYQSCTASPLISCPQPNLELHGWQGGQQPVSVHCSQSVSQAWQYPQHLLQQQYQQQVVQMLPQQQYQQSYQQLQHFPLQQQFNQQQVSSWQQQQQLWPSIPYQVQQLEHQQQANQQLGQHYHQFTRHLQLHQGQQQQLLPVNEQQLQIYHQSEKLSDETNEQGYLCNTTQAYQASLQQYQLDQQGHGQMLLQYQQHSNQYTLVQQQQLHLTPLQQQQHHGQQQQQHQQRTSRQDPPQGTNHHLQGRKAAAEASDSAQLQHLSPQSMAQPITDNQSWPAASMHNQLPSSGTSHSHDMDTPESAGSSHHGQRNP